MKKQKEWPKELVYIDLNRVLFEFYNIELIKIGFNNFQVIFHYGKFHNKGTNKIYRFNGSNSYSNARKLAYKKFYEMKSKGYIRKEKIEEALLNAIKQEQKFDNERKSQKKPKTQNNSKKNQCDLCNQPIHFSLSQKINAWGRGEGNWDFSINSPLYHKIVCLDCQIDNNIFQKRIDESFKL
ncbi:WGR domain-containing protein [Bacillus mexicanus]|uniref:WGR domain-containing protein n=1 Tax=Bacillus mexicanus TaxID=2834415 RepID=UPI003D23148E